MIPMPKKKEEDADEKAIREIIKDPVGPMLMEKFTKMSQQDLHTFLTEKKQGYLTSVLNQNPSELNSIRGWLQLVPFSYREKLRKVLLDKAWLKYYIETEIKANRPDLYIEMAYNHGAVDYILSEIGILLNYVA